MAIVANKNGLGQPDFPIDRPYCTHNRSNAGTPNGTLTPQYAGELVWDTTNKVRWKAIALTNADWEPTQAEVT